MCDRLWVLWSVLYDAVLYGEPSAARSWPGYLSWQLAAVVVAIGSSGPLTDHRKIISQINGGIDFGTQ